MAMIGAKQGNKNAAGPHKMRGGIAKIGSVTVGARRDANGKSWAAGAMGSKKSSLTGTPRNGVLAGNLAGTKVKAVQAKGKNVYTSVSRGGKTERSGTAVDATRKLGKTIKAKATSASSTATSASSTAKAKVSSIGKTIKKKFS